MPEKEKIFPGDTFPVSYECRMPDPDNDRNTYGLPAEPEDAFARLVDGNLALVELGGPGSTTAPVQIIPKTGETSNDKGAILNFTVSEDFTQEPGDYILYITAVYEGGTVRTEDRKFKVLEMSTTTV